MHRSTPELERSVNLLPRSNCSIEAASAMWAKNPDLLKVVEDWLNLTPNVSGELLVIAVFNNDDFEVEFLDDEEHLRRELPDIAIELRRRMGPLEGVPFEVLGDVPASQAYWIERWSSCVASLRTRRESKRLTTKSTRH